MERPKAEGTMLEESERVVITQWRFAPGAETGWHTHALDYVVVYRTPAFHRVETAEGVREVTLEAGQSYYRAAGVQHNVINASAEEVVLVEVELKPARG